MSKTMVVTLVVAAAAVVGALLWPAPATDTAKDATGPTERIRTWPGEDTTGVADEARLEPSGSVTTDRDGQVIEDLDITGSIKVEHSDVTIRNVRVRSTGLFGIHVPADLHADVDDLVIEDTEIAGISGDRAVGLAQYGRWTARRIDVHGFEDGVKMSSGQVLEDSWIHDLHQTDDSHNDGIQSVGGRDGVIRNNAIEAPDDQTAAIMLQTNNAALTGWLIAGNRLSGGGYTVYLEDKEQGYGPPTNITVRDNVWVQGTWKHGPLRIDAGPGLSWSGNSYDDGRPYPDPTASD